MPRGGCVLHSDGMVETVHEATTPQRTGGQRQRSGAWSTLSAANGAIPAGALSPRAEGQPAACWGRREGHMARRAEETSTPQENVDALRGPERRRLQKRTDVAIPHSTCEMPDDEAETCEGVRVWELPY